MMASPPLSFGPHPWAALRRLGEAVLLVGVATFVALVLAPKLDLTPLILIFILPVVVQSGRHGWQAGFLTSVLGALSYNFFLIPPRFTLRIAEAENVFAIGIFLLVALIVSDLAGRLRAARLTAAQLAQAAACQAEFAERLTHVSEPERVGSLLVEMLQAALGLSARIVSSAAPQADDMSELDIAALRWALDTREPAGAGTGLIEGAGWMWLALGGRTGALWALAVRRADATALGADDRTVIAALVDRACQALDRLELARAQRAQEDNAARARTAEAVLAAIGHDLRTPLTVLRGHLSDLASPAADPAALDEARAQIARLERLVGNVLEVARLTAGGARPAAQIIDLVDSIADVLAGYPATIASAIQLDVAEDAPLLRCDGRMLHHMLANLLENALRHGGGPSGVAIATQRAADGLLLMVTDHGPGFGPQAATLFDRLPSLSSPQRKDGAGLGLMIVKGFADAMGLGLTAGAGPDGGACVTLHFPSPMLCAPQ